MKKQSNKKQNEQLLIKKSYETISAIISQWHEKNLSPGFFSTPYELNELQAELGQAIEKQIKKSGEADPTCPKNWSENPKTEMECSKCQTKWNLKDSIGCPKCDGKDGGIK